MSHVCFPESIQTTEPESVVCAALAGEIEPLFDLQLRVARRADWLARYGTLARAEDRAFWLRAEQEIFEVMERAGFELAGEAPSVSR